MGEDDFEHVWNERDYPGYHGGPGHRFGDPTYCGECWWEEIRRYQSPRRREHHAPDCPGCEPAALRAGDAS